MRDENKEGVLRRFLDTIFEISDEDFQKRIWIKGLGPECSDFDETICDFFDNGEDIMLNYKNYGISEDQYKILLTINKRIRAFSDRIPEGLGDKFIISDPEWHKIVKMAKKVLKAFDYKK